jgi:UrcA family protein
MGIKHTIIVGPLAILMTIGIAAAAEAKDDPAPSVAVKTADLDLNRASDRRMLDRRVAAATQEVCSTGRVLSLPEPPAMKRCRNIALANANRQVAALRSSNQIATR